jgi:excisionase family DNA binding protein
MNGRGVRRSASRLEKLWMHHRWLSVEDIAKHLGVGKDVVYTWVSSKRLPDRRFGYLLRTNAQPWEDRGCILFSQCYDTAFSMGGQLAAHPALREQDIRLYAGETRSGLWSGDVVGRCHRETRKMRVRGGSLRLLVGTGAASEWLNLQRLETLINIDLPWNPTRLEQRKGRIQRIGHRPDGGPLPFRAPIGSGTPDDADGAR